MKGEHKGFFLACIRVTEHNSTTAARLTEHVRELEMQSVKRYWQAAHWNDASVIELHQNGLVSGPPLFHTLKLRSVEFFNGTCNKSSQYSCSTIERRKCTNTGTLFSQPHLVWENLMPWPRSTTRICYTAVTQYPHTYIPFSLLCSAACVVLWSGSRVKNGC